MKSDEELAEEAKQGSAAAFDELVIRYQERLLRFLLVRCNNRADAEDAIQDTFVNAYRYLQSYNPRWRFSTWIYRIAIRNASRQSLRQPAALEDLVDSADPLSSCIAGDERENLWLAAREVLAEDAYSALWLRYVEDLALADVAEALDRSLAWTKVSLMRSRRRLEQRLRDESASPYGSQQHGRQ
jgi:RNA polymerase sigma-70 factor, ECF subfamily